MNLTFISISACGDYSGNEYKESRWIKTESYEKLKDQIDKLDIYIGDLDGKHSEVQADKYIQHYTQKELENMELDLERDGCDLEYHLENLYNKSCLDFQEEQDKILKYINSLDSYIEIPVSIKKSQVEKFKQVMRENGWGYEKIFMEFLTED